MVQFGWWSGSQSECKNGLISIVLISNIRNVGPWMRYALFQFQTINK